MNLLAERKRINELRTDRKTAVKQWKIEKVNRKTTRLQLRHEKEAQIIAQEVAQVVQQQAHERIESVVCKCLEAIFGDLYRFKIDFQRKRGRTEANLILLKDGHEIRDPLNEDSGGVVDIAALALRLACIVLAKPSLKRIIIMDEPFRNLDMENRVKVRLLLDELSEDFKVQFILVTHETAFQIGKVIRI